MNVLVFALLIGSALAAFGVTSTGNGFRVDTGAGLVFVVSKSTADITSLVYHGVEYQAPGKATHVNSGLGQSSVSSRTVGSNYIVITAKSRGNPVTQYFVAKKGDSRVYLATDITKEVNPGELRFLARLRKARLPKGVKHPVADNAGGAAIEGKDVFRVSGQTRCKFFSSERFIDDHAHGVHGSNATVSMLMPAEAYETASGGPFMRDINNQGTSDQQELYFYMNSGHLRTEPWRMGLKGPYALSFSTHAEKAAFDTSFFSGLGIHGYVPAASRGKVTGVATGVPSKFQTVLHWFNSQNQYWAYADKSGRFTSPLMKPGSYTMRLYKQEFPVAHTTVRVTAGGKVETTIASPEKSGKAIWRVGEFDGQPFEFKNGDKFLTMHPSDSRMSRWGGTYTVGSSSARAFPMAIFAKTGGTGDIVFNLNSTQTGAAVLRVGTTLSFKGGQPNPSIGTWRPSARRAPKNLNSRGITRGGYRGLGEMYEFPIPTGVLKAGRNVLKLGVHGSGDQGYLSANYIVDAIELVHK